MKSCKIYIIISFILLSFQSYSQIKLYKSNLSKPLKVDFVRSILKIESVPGKEVKSSDKKAAAPGLATILPAVLDVGITVVKSELKKREESFTAEYKSKASHSGIWQENTPYLPKLTFERSYSPSNKILHVELTPESSIDGRAFRYKLETLNLIYSEARANKKKPIINFEFDIKLSGFTKNEEKITKADIGQSSITFEGAKFDNENNISPKTEAYSGWFPILPPDQGQGIGENYEIELTVKEANPGILKAKKIREFFDDNGEKLQEAAKVIIQNVLTEDKSKDNDSDQSTDNDGEKEGTANAEKSNSVRNSVRNETGIKSETRKARF